MKALIKEARQNKGLLIRELAHSLGIDQALVSKFESGVRKPTREQALKIADLLDISVDIMMVEWLKYKILAEIEDEGMALKALEAAEAEIKYRRHENKTSSYGSCIDSILKEIDSLKVELDNYRHLDSYRIAQALELEYTYESNRIEGNTLTLKETDLVINEGLTISGKSMREHLEAINHKDAIEYVKYMAENKSVINERSVLSIHNLILRGIDSSNAGKYRNVNVMIKGSRHMPPQPFLVPKQMEDFFHWYESEGKKLHPVVLAAELHERLVTIHPFIDGNGRTSRLLMNLMLLKNGYVIANLKGDSDSRIAYYSALEKAQADQDKTEFIELIAQTELISIQRYISVISGK